MDPVDAQHARSPLPIRHRGSNGAEIRRGIGETVKNALLSLKKENRSLEGRTYQKLRLSGETRGSFHPRLPSSPVIPLHFPLLRLIRLLILYFAFLVPRLPSLLRTPTIASRASIASLRDPEIPAKSASRISAWINFRKQKPVLEDYDRANRK